MTTRKILLLSWLAICGLAGFLTLQTQAFSETPQKGASADVDVTDFNDWRFACVADKRGQKSCRIFQNVVWKTDKTHSANMTAVFFPVVVDPKSKLKVKPVALMRLVFPLGSNLTPGIAMVIGSKEKKQIKRPYHVCEPAGCLVDTLVTDETIAKIKAADAVLIGYAPAGAKPTTLKISLNGFSKAYDALAKTAHAKGK